MTLDGLTESAETAASGGGDVMACDVKRRTDDHAPAVPTALMPRTCHQCRRASSVGAVNWDVVTVRSTTSGAENVLESSIWIRYDVAAVTSVAAKAR
jgi:hypothetical protein